MTTRTSSIDLDKFRHSSDFSAGDAFSFSIRLGDSELPGKFDPAKYLDGLDLDITGHIAVICPGNGGLCVELMRRGAVVTAFEPRNRFLAALHQVSKFHDEIHQKTYKIIDGLPDHKSGPFDLIVWSEGLDEVSDPIKPLKSVISCLIPGGALVIELDHGNHTALPDHINSWRPTPDAFAESIEKLGIPCSIGDRLKGRNNTRSKYTIRNDTETITSNEDEPIVIIDDDDVVDNKITTQIDNTTPSDDNGLTKSATTTKKKKRRGRPPKSESNLTTPKRRRRKKNA